MESRSWIAWPWAALAIVLGLGVLVITVAATVPSGGYYGMMSNGGPGWWVLMMAVPAFILIMVLLALLGGFREPSGAVFVPAYVPPGANALDALEQRYARGELSREDYLRIRADLTHGPTGT